MEELRTSLERVVSAGVQAYIGLLCAGEIERSRRVLSDALQLSSLGSGGPSQRIPVSLFGNEPGDGAGSLARVMAYYTLRSLLASLLVLRATRYWSRVPALAELQSACSRFNECLERDHGVHPESDDEAAGVSSAEQATRGARRRKRALIEAPGSRALG